MKKTDIAVFIIACVVLVLAGLVLSGNKGIVIPFADKADPTQGSELVDGTDHTYENEGDSFANFGNSPDNPFEVSIAGATGWPVCDMNLLDNPNSSASVISTVMQGEPFCIINETGDYLHVIYEGNIGFIDQAYCFINLPDVMPSTEYDITNAYSSIFRSSGTDIPGLTGMQLYDYGRQYNQRLEREEFIAPMLYSTAKKVAAASSLINSMGYRFRIYDTYRPHSVTVLAATQLQELYNSDENVRHNIDYDANGGYWGQSWFLAQGVSTHNTGSALDVSLVDINTGEEVSMQCPMHELSTQALKTGGDDLSYVFGEADMVGIASEWWHFQDDTGHSRILSRTGALDIQFTSISSVSVEQVYAYMMGDESQVPVSY